MFLKALSWWLLFLSRLLELPLKSYLMSFSNSYSSTFYKLLISDLSSVLKRWWFLVGVNLDNAKGVSWWSMAVVIFSLIFYELPSLLINLSISKGIWRLDLSSIEIFYWFAKSLLIKRWWSLMEGLCLFLALRYMIDLNFSGWMIAWHLSWWIACSMLTLLWVSISGR